VNVFRPALCGVEDQYADVSALRVHSFYLHGQRMELALGERSLRKHESAGDQYREDDPFTHDPSYGNFGHYRLKYDCKA
jgi:hypothetical protein